MKKKMILSFTVFLSLTPHLQARNGLFMDTAHLKSGADENNSNDDLSIYEYQKGDVCIIPYKYKLDETISHKKKDLEKEHKLCEIDFNTRPLCPKLNSTNPGTLVVEMDQSKDHNFFDPTDANCKNKDFGVEAKFKQSITCSYTPSALAAYHLSRILGNQLITPVTVARSMDQKKHEKLIDQALRILKGRNQEIIYKSWNQFKNQNATVSEPKLYLQSEKNPLLYGALSENPKREFIYTEVSGVGPYETRYERFRQQIPFKRVSDERSVKEIIEHETPHLKSLPALQQMIDVSNMIVLDTLLNQDDRIGNIHFYLSYATFNSDGSYTMDKLKKEDLNFIQNTQRKKYKSLSRWKEEDITNATEIYKKYKLDQNLKENKKTSFNTNGILVRQMILKDNDCGVDVDKRSNNMKRISAVESLRHISPTTYHNLLRLHEAAQKRNHHNDSNSRSLNEFFIKTLLYREKDYQNTKGKGFMDNLKKVTETLVKNCKNGLLKLDLEIQKTSSNRQFSYPTESQCILSEDVLSQK